MKINGSYLSILKKLRGASKHPKEEFSPNGRAYDNIASI